MTISQQMLVKKTPKTEIGNEQWAMDKAEALLQRKLVNCQSPVSIAYCLLPIAYCLLPIFRTFAILSFWL